MPTFDFLTLAVGLAGISFPMVGMMWVFAPMLEDGENVRQNWIPKIIKGILLIIIGPFIIGLLQSSAVP